MDRMEAIKELVAVGGSAMLPNSAVEYLLDLAEFQRVVVEPAPPPSPSARELLELKTRLAQVERLLEGMADGDVEWGHAQAKAREYLHQQKFLYSDQGY